MLLPYLKKTYIGIIFFLLSLIIVLIWFKSGLYYGGAEVGVGPYYHPSRYLDIQKSIWWESTAPGGLVPQFVAGVPLYFILSLLEKIFSPLIIQAILFLLLLFMMGFGMYLFVSSYFNKNKIIYATIAGLFYMFNSYMMVAVWHRFLYTGFFLGASLPILALFWKLWIDKDKFIYLTLFLLTNLAFVYMYANLTSTIVVWILCFLLTVARVIFPWQRGKNCLNTALKLLLGLSLFLLTNLWWLIPVFKVSTGVLSQQHSIEDDISTLINISKQTILPFTLQFANPFYLFYTQELGSIYTSFIFQVLPWLPAAVIFIGILQSLKNKMFASFGLFYLLSILIAKGAAGPFGYPYIWGFINFFALGIIRNPFEKLGILLPFFGSLLFIIGLEALMVFSTKRIGKPVAKMLAGIILISILIYAFPMFTGRVFNKPDYPLEVKVPETYEQANNWFRVQKNLEGNILHLPFPDKDVVTYNWEHGYHGVEINEILFTALPSITRNVGVKRVDNTLGSLSFIFNQPFSQNRQMVLRLLQSLNIRYIVLHKDTKWNDIATYSKDININQPIELEKTLDNFDFLQKEVTFGDLVIYKLKDSSYQPKIILTPKADLVYPGESNIMRILSITDNKDQMITPISDLSDSALSKIENLSIFPKSSLDYAMASESALLAVASSMVSDPAGNDSTKSQLRVMQNTFSQTGELSSQKLAEEFNLANDNLIKIYHSDASAVDVYQELLKRIFNRNLKTSNFFKTFNKQISQVFYLHLYILEQIGQQGLNDQSKIGEIKKNLIDNLKINNLLPIYIQPVLPGKEEVNMKILQLEIPVKSKYELVIPYYDIPNLYPDLLSKLDVRINNQPLSSKARIEKNAISFSNIDLEKGNYEISYNSLLSENLVPSLNKFLTFGTVESSGKDIMFLNSAKGGVAFLESPIRVITGGDTFKINIDALFKSGTYLYLEIISDSEEFDDKKEYQTIKSGECSFHNCYLIKLNSPYNVWQNYTFLSPALNLSSQKANIRILAVSEMQNSQQTPTEALIRNFKISRVYNEDIMLRSKLTEGLADFTNSVKINYQVPTMYQGKITIDKPSFLFFKETYNPGWSLKLSDGQIEYNINDHHLGDLYGNSYYIDKIGNFDFKLEFEPQKNVSEGLIISTISWVGILLSLIYFEYKRRNEYN